MFIVFEGLDGSGSTTQAKLLVEFLKKQKIKALHTSEPTTNTLGKLIRQALQQKFAVSPEALQLLFCADRAEHLRTEIEPALRAKKIVVCDRYAWSTIAYGSLSTETPWLKDLNRIFLKPDFTFVLDVPIKTCLQRIAARGKKELFEEETKLKKVWQVFFALVKQEKKCAIIDGTLSKENILAEVLKILRHKFPAQF